MEIVLIVGLPTVFMLGYYLGQRTGVRLCKREVEISDEIVAFWSDLSEKLVELLMKKTEEFNELVANIEEADGEPDWWKRGENPPF